MTPPPTGPPAPTDPARADAAVRDLRLVPLAVAAWAGAWLGTDARPSRLAAAAAVALVLVGVAVVRRSPRWAALALALVTTTTLGGVAAARLAGPPVAGLAGTEAVVTVDAVLTADPTTGGSGRQTFTTVRARALAVTGRGSSWRVRAPILVVAAGRPAGLGHPVGTRVRLLVRLQPPDRGSDLVAVARLRGPPVVLAPPGRALRAVERIRAGLRASVARRPEEPRALVPALVLGDTSAMTPGLEADFRSTGLTHLTAVSGANLTLLLAFVLLTARWLGVRGWWLRVLGLLGVAGFVALCRTEPSVLRAAAMGLVALAALGTGGGRGRGLRHLAAATVVLLGVDPHLARSLGFTLSVLASGGIVWWAGRWAAAMTWLPRPLGEAIAVPLAAHLATLPVVASIAGTVSVSGVLANALAGPLVGPATVLGFAAAGLSLLSPFLARLAGWGASWCAQGIIWVAHGGAALPGSQWRWPASPLGLALLATFALAAALAAGRVLSRWWLTLGLAVLLVGGVLHGPVQPGWPPRDWIVVACDVGQGDGLAVRVGRREALLIDAGPDPPAIDRCLDGLGVDRLPLVVLSHFHADHVDGLAAALEDRAVGALWVSPLASPPAEAALVRRIAAGRGVPVRTPAMGERGTVGPVGWEVLGPVPVPGPPSLSADPADSESAAENDSSLVLRLTVSGVRVLLTGDVEPDGQRRILATGADLTADVLKVPHHGSGRQEPAFLAATRARVALASAGVENDYGHPAPRTVAALHALGMTVLRTDQQGSVAVTLRDGSLGAVSQRPPAAASR